MSASAAPQRTSAPRPTLELGPRPWLMGIVNATPDSFSDGGAHGRSTSAVELARALLAAGADIIDIGGESGVTNRPAVDAQEEIERVVPLIERVAGELGALVSVDTYKPPVARGGDRRRRVHRQRRQRAARPRARRRRARRRARRSC